MMSNTPYPSNWPYTGNVISPDEFTFPEKIDPVVIARMYETRMLLGVPCYFTTNTRQTFTYHPHGDAVDPDSTSHSVASLHKWGIDHQASKAQGHTVYDSDVLGQALDWDCNILDLDDFFDVYLKMVQSQLWNRIGVYPFWHRLGFHTDLGYNKYNWFRDSVGDYHTMTWKNWKQHVILHPATFPNKENG